MFLGPLTPPLDPLLCAVSFRNFSAFSPLCNPSNANADFALDFIVQYHAISGYSTNLALLVTSNNFYFSSPDHKPQKRSGTRFNLILLAIVILLILILALVVIILIEIKSGKLMRLCGNMHLVYFEKE